MSGPDARPRGPLRLYLASANPNKAAEFQALADSLRGNGPALIIASAAEVGGMPPVSEDTGSFAGNAAKKARALMPLLPEGAWALADDSGLCVDALGGAPGVESAYFAGPRSDAPANLAKLVEAMRGVPAKERGAEFVCTLAAEPRGCRGFGYDPLFVPQGHELTMAEMAPLEKNRISHRGRAWVECVGWLAAGPQTVL
jgi:XTP/dITP diphosphohydrolase